MATQNMNGNSALAVCEDCKRASDDPPCMENPGSINCHPENCEGLNSPQQIGLDTAAGRYGIKSHKPKRKFFGV